MESKLSVNGVGASCHDTRAASGCGGGSGLAGSELPAAIRAKIDNHPCFSEDAHHHYARMHVAVAPACNIQCHYCNRKYDCSNESRPGVVSELLTPDQAVSKVLAVAAAIPQMTVLGIAGPGDPLANPQRTLETFRQLTEKAPDIKLCVSTNGLALPELVDELCLHNIEHVTITINCVDPDVGAQIYPWIFWKNRRVTGRKAAEILIAQQQKGLEMLVARGVLVKVNSVLIPGVNDEHLKEVSRVVKAKGAFLHNVMPLIAEPEHGTFYGLMGQRGPTAGELGALQEACAGDMRMMRHCRQCRADAVGMLGEDRGAEFTLEKIAGQEIDYAAAMVRRAEVHASIEAQRATKNQTPCATQVPSPRPRTSEAYVSLASLTRRRPTQPATRPVLMAVATTDGQHVDQHFAQARTFALYEASASGIRFIGERRVVHEQGGSTSRDDTTRALQQTIEMLAGCEVVLCSRIGYEPWGHLEAAGIRPNGEYAMAPIEAAITAVYREMVAAGHGLSPVTTPVLMTA
ncbi:nitrogenase cofactor biosynthesis protein NifB [Thiocapsa imhoffii]|uniref:FeMo cofactor biosynthesis protein NifB n=1 Tax=Thiocapsa imhoffii TaxID=382777 RepID=A0A9X0WIS9_9GAMM|nr:nitrogenase cofactor biosynthesis protein NifB [Thiocapsa imhoffii]MBK1645526.1 nitrogenase cofactor biosynthesis protein NifB [Thiocapsa imhoffii]